MGLPTNALNKVFMNLYEKIDINNYLDSIKSYIVKRNGSHRMPKNTEVIEAIKYKDVYNIKAKNRLYLLSRIENFNNKEVVAINGNPDITIEHIFPQKPDKSWKMQLSELDFKEMKEEYVHTLGNLTLSGNNGSLGNRDFIYKRDIIDKGYKDSRLWLNKYLSEIEDWNKNTFEERVNILTKRCLSIWSYPDVYIGEYDESLEEMSIFEAENPTHKKLEYAVLFGQKLNVKTVASLYIDVFKHLFEQSPEMFFNTDLSEKVGLHKHPNESKLRAAGSISSNYFIETNFSNVAKFEIIKYALEVFDSEDELNIKYVA